MKNCYPRSQRRHKNGTDIILISVGRLELNVRSLGHDIPALDEIACLEHAALAMSPLFPPSMYQYGRSLVPDQNTQHQIRNLVPLRAYWPAMAGRDFLKETIEIELLRALLSRGRRCREQSSFGLLWLLRLCRCSSFFCDLLLSCLVHRDFFSLV